MVVLGSKLDNLGTAEGYPNKTLRRGARQAPRLHCTSGKTTSLAEKISGLHISNLCSETYDQSCAENGIHRMKEL